MLKIQRSNHVLLLASVFQCVGDIERDIPKTRTHTQKKKTERQTHLPAMARELFTYFSKFTCTPAEEEEPFLN